MKNLFATFWRWLVRLFLGGRPSVTVEFLEDDPESPLGSTLYVIGGIKHPWKAMMVCPCGCGEVIELNLAPPGRPLWRITSLNNRPITLHPSVWRTTGCRSHFWLRHGEVQWCDAISHGKSAG